MAKNEKKVLFVLKRAALGGSAASLINLLSIYKERGVEFDLFLMDHNGEWTENAARYANLLPKNKRLEASITEKKNLKSPIQYFHRICHVIRHKIFGVEKVINALYKKSAKNLNGKYDCAIAYQESETTAFVQYIESIKKTTWIHTDFAKFCELSPRYSSKSIYDRFDDIVCVTESSVSDVIERFGRSGETVHLIKNMLPTSILSERANEWISYEKSHKYLFVSVGRLSNEKAYDRIPRVARLLKDDGFDFEWLIIGEGDARATVEAEIERNAVSEAVHLLGFNMNPYPYIKLADALVITSLYEAQPMVANEALILNTPVISTEFSSVREVISDNENGAVVEQNAEALAEALERFMSDDEYREKIINGATKFIYSNESEILKLEALLHGKE